MKISEMIIVAIIIYNILIVFSNILTQFQILKIHQLKLY